MHHDEPDATGTGAEAAAIEEPPNSTVDDWFGQNVARDQEVADRAAAEEDDLTDAQERFDAEADGEARYRAGHPRPGAERS